MKKVEVTMGSNCIGRNDMYPVYPTLCLNYYRNQRAIRNRYYSNIIKSRVSTDVEPDDDIIFQKPLNCQ